MAVSTSSSDQTKYHTYTISFKLHVVDYVNDGHSKKSTSKYFGIHRKRVQVWCASEEKLRKASRNAKRLSGCGRPIRYGAIDYQLIQWFHDRWAAGVRITGKVLKQSYPTT